MPLSGTTWAWLIGGALFGGVLGFLGFFSEDGGWGEAMVGAIIGSLAAAWQIVKERGAASRPRGPATVARKAAPEPHAEGAQEEASAPSLPNRNALWRRSKHARYANWIFFYASLFAIFFVIGLAVADPDQFWDVTIYGVLVLFAFGVGLYKRHAAKREVAAALRILERGIPTEGRVRSREHKEIKDSRTPIRFSLGWIVTYSYFDKNGNSHTGASGFIPEREASNYWGGVKVRIVFDPNDPGRSVWAEPCSIEQSRVRGRRIARPSLSPWAVVAGLLALVLASVLLVVWLPFAAGVIDAFDDEAGGFPWRDGAVERRPLTGLKGVKLGESFVDVQMRVARFDPEPRGKPGSSTEPLETYIQSNGALQLWVRDRKVKGISYNCQSRGDVRVNRIACGAMEQRILDVFGAEVRVLCAKVADDDPRKADAAFARAYDVLATGTRHVAESGRVTGFIVMAPGDLTETVGSLWHPCERE